MEPLLLSSNINEWKKSVPTETIKNISSNLNKYIQLQNDFSNTEKIFNADNISKFMRMPQNIHLSHNPVNLKGKLKHTHERENKNNFFSKISNKLFKQQMDNNYQIQKSIYEILRSQSNFTNHRKDIEENGHVRRFNANSESFKSSWIDRGVTQKTSNLESTKFDLINNSNCNRPNLKSILYGASNDCHKVKSISEFCDISSVKSPKKFIAYHQSAINNTLLFQKNVGICAKRCDLAKTYGPFFPIHKK